MRKRLLYKNILGKIQLLILLLIVASISVQAQTFNMVGSAKLTTANPYYFTMTDGTPNISSAVWSSNKIDLRYNFNIKFLLNFNNAAGTSSDGMTFTLQSASNFISGYSVWRFLFGPLWNLSGTMR